MPTIATVYRILVASPSDVNEEREIVRRVISEWNATNSLRYSVSLEPVLWESHSRPEMGDRPQELLNKQILSYCDFLIGIFWTRIGTHTGKAESGSVEEISEFITEGNQFYCIFQINPFNLTKSIKNNMKNLKNLKKNAKKRAFS